MCSKYLVDGISVWDVYHTGCIKSFTDRAIEDNTKQIMITAEDLVLNCQLCTLPHTDITIHRQWCIAKKIEVGTR